MNYLNIMSNYQRELLLYKITIFKNIHSLFNKILSFLTITSIYIATAGFLVSFFSFVLYEINIDFVLPLASFFATFAIYNLNKLTDIKEDSINLVSRAKFTEKNKHYIIFSIIIASFAALYLSFLQSLSAIYIILFPFCIGFVYSIKISTFRLKDIIGIKSIAVALAWAVIGAFMPIAVHSSNLTMISLIFFFFCKIIYKHSSIRCT